MDVTIECGRVEKITRNFGISSNLSVSLEDVSPEQIVDAVGTDTILEAVGRNQAINYWGIEEAE